MSTADIAKALADGGEGALAEKVLQTEVEVDQSLAHFGDSERRGELTALYGLTFKQRRIILETVMAAGGGGAPYAARMNQAIVGELKMFEALEEMSEEEQRSVMRANFYTDYTELSQIPRWSEHETNVSDADRLIVRIKSRWGDEKIEHLAEEDVQPKAQPSKELSDKVSVFLGNICSLEVDAVVNAANGSLRGGGGIDGAIHSQSGPLLDEECIGLCGCDTGSSKITRGYRMPSKHIIHTVGPMGEHPDELRSCYESVLAIVKDNGIRSVAFCCVSTGIFGFPLVHATHIAISTVRKWLEDDSNRQAVDRIVFCLFLPHELQVYERLMPTYFPA